MPMQPPFILPPSLQPLSQHQLPTAQQHNHSVSALLQHHSVSVSAAEPPCTDQVSKRVAEAVARSYAVLSATQAAHHHQSPSMLLLAPRARPPLRDAGGAAASAPRSSVAVQVEGVSVMPLTTTAPVSSSSPSEHADAGAAASVVTATSADAFLSSSSLHGRPAVNVTAVESSPSEEAGGQGQSRGRVSVSAVIRALVEEQEGGAGGQCQTAPAPTTTQSPPLPSSVVSFVRHASRPLPPPTLMEVARAQTTLSLQPLTGGSSSSGHRLNRPEYSALSTSPTAFPPPHASTSSSLSSSGDNGGGGVEVGMGELAAAVGAVSNAAYWGPIGLATPAVLKWAAAWSATQPPPFTARPPMHSSPPQSAQTVRLPAPLAAAIATLSHYGG